MRGNSLEGTNELIFEIGIFFFFFNVLYNPSDLRLTKLKVDLTFFPCLSSTSGM